MLFVKRIISIFILFTIIAVSALPVLAVVHEEDRKVVKIAYLADHGIVDDPYIKGNEGYGFEYFEEIAQYSGHDYEYVETDIETAISMLNSGEVDLYAPATMTEERLQQYDFVPHIFGYESICIFALDSSPYFYQDRETFDGLRIGLSKGIVFEEHFDIYLEENNIDIEKVYFTDSNYYEMLESGKCDLVLGASLYPQDGIKIVDKVGKEPFYYMTQKGNDELISEIMYGVEQIEKEQNYFAEGLYLKYYGSFESGQGTITRDELDALSYKDVYSCGYNINHYPVSYLNDDGEPDGFAIDIMDEIARQAGIEIAYVPIGGDLNYDESTLDFTTCIINNNDTGQGHYTDSYISLPMVALRKSEVLPDEVQTIASLDYETLNISEFTNSNYPNSTVIKTKSMEENLDLFYSNEVDCLVLSSRVVNSILDTINTDEYDIDALPISLPIGITVSYDLPYDIFSTINKLVSGLDPIFIEDAVISSIANLPIERNLWQNIVNYKDELILAGAIFVSISLFLYLLQAKRKRDALNTILEIDPLTGHMTRYKFLLEANKILSTAKPEEYALLVIDIDNFKSINKTCGYDVGDKVLISIANSINEIIDDKSLLCRDGKDTFLILIHNTDEVLSIENRFNNDSIILDALNSIVEHKTSVSFSHGVYLIKDPSEDMDMMIDCASIARLQGKQTHGATTFFYTEEMHQNQLHQNKVVDEMENALKNNEFFIVLQPKYALDTEKIIGAEALVRWRDSNGEIIFPDKFIPIFEQNGFIAKLDLYVFECTCALLEKPEFKDITLSVNISVATVQNEDCSKNYMNILKKYNLNPNQIEIEITETAVSTNFDLINKRISDFKNCGFTISVDDFGAGGSTLNRLRDMEIDIIKIDKAFIDNNLTSEKGLAIVNSIITLSKQLNLSTVAEGIETLEQKEALLHLNCEIGQGYFFSKPISVDDFILLLKSHNSKINSSTKTTASTIAKKDNIPSLPELPLKIETHNEKTEIWKLLADEKNVGITITDSISSELYYANETAFHLFDIAPIELENANFPVVVQEFCQISDKENKESYSDLFITSTGTALKMVSSSILWMGKNATMKYFYDVSSETSVLHNSEMEKTALEIALHQNKVSYIRYNILDDTAELAEERLSDYYGSKTVKDFSYVAPKFLLDEGSSDSFSKLLAKITDGSPSVNPIYIKFQGLPNRWFVCEYTLLQDEFSNSKEAIISYRDITENREKELALERVKNLTRWQISTDSILYEANVTEGIFEYSSEKGGMDSFIEKYGSANMDSAIEATSKNFVIPKFRKSYLNFYNRDRILKLYENGILEDSIDIQTSSNDTVSWFRQKASFAMDPFSKNLKIFINYYNVDKEYETIENLTSAANTDSLTGLLNKKQTEKLIKSTISNLKENDSAALFIIDIDNFKRINDDHGHLSGDNILKEVSSRLKTIFRESDILGRMGGDEFMAFVSPIRSIDSIKQKAEQIQISLSKPYGEFDFTSSIGATMCTNQNCEFEKLYAATDKELYKAKNAGKNRYSISELK